jgi:hypothetical protein
LEKLDGITAAFVNESITLLLDNDQPLDQAAIKAALEPFKFELGEIRKEQQLPF